MPSLASRYAEDKSNSMKTARLRCEHFLIGIFVTIAVFVALLLRMPAAFSQTASANVSVLQTSSSEAESQYSYLKNRIQSPALALQTYLTQPPVVVSIPLASQPSLVEADRAMQFELNRWIGFGNPSRGLTGAFPKEPPSRELKDFFIQTLIPKEALYFELGVGLDEATGLPYDHIRYRPQAQMISEVGNYTAASKVSLSIPFLLNVIQKKPGFTRLSGWTVPLARQKLLTALLTVKRFAKDFPNYRGFLPWVDIRPNGTIAPANAKIPSLDNGQMTWAIAAVASVFESSDHPEEVAIKETAEEILAIQNYAHFYDSQAGMLHGTIQVAHRDGRWVGDKTYYLNDMFEGTLAVLWGVLHNQIPETAWTNLKIPTVDYQTQSGDQVSTFQGFRSSFHEWWALAYLPFMKSPLAPLFHNYLFVQADHALRKRLPGFTSTAFDAQGVYRQMGVPAIAGQKVDRDDVAVVFGTSIATLISPITGGEWLRHLYQRPGLVTPFGAVESMGPDGFADIFTADAKGMTVLASSGGVVSEIESYLKSRVDPATGLTLYEKLMRLFESKYNQMLHERGDKPILTSSRPIPLPPSESLEPRFAKPENPGESFDISRHLQSGHLHGKNVTSIGLETLEDDVKSGELLRFHYEIPSHFIYFDQWAFRGTYLDRAVRISEMNYLTVEIPMNAKKASYEIELKSDDITLASASVSTTDSGIVSEDGRFKTVVYPVYPVPESDYKALNYVSISLHDPRYVQGASRSEAREGRVEIRSLKLEKTNPMLQQRSQLAPAALPEVSAEMPILRFWRLSHGDMAYRANAEKGSLVFEGGRAWRGGYVPYSDLSKFRYLYLKIRNRSGKPNLFSLEMKHELNQILGKKVFLHLDASDQWRYYQISVPQKKNSVFNYMAVSDADGAFEISKAFLSERPVSSLNAQKVSLDRF